MRLAKRVGIVAGLCGFLLVSSSAGAAVTVSDWTDLASKTTTQLSGFVLNRATGTFDNILTVANSSPDRIAMPIIAALQGLPAGVSLVNAYGVSSEGLPFVVTGFSGALGSSQTVPVILKFSNPSQVRITFTYRILQPPTAVINLLVLSGADADGDGIRDDLQAALKARYGPLARPDLLAAARQFAMTLTAVMTDSTTTERAFDAAVAYNKSFDCLVELYGSDEAINEGRTLRRLVVNTKERVQAILDSGDKLAGQTGRVGTANACNVAP